jgi:hypothetical protein
MGVQEAILEVTLTEAILDVTEVMLDIPNTGSSRGFTV